MIRRIICVCMLLLSAPLFAAEVIKTKGKSVLIELKGDPAAPGDQFYSIRPDGKRAAILKITKVKGDKAIGVITRGKAAAGHTLEIKPAAVTQEARQGTAGTRGRSSTSPINPTGRAYWGAIAGFAMDSMDVNVNNFNDNSFLQRTSLSGNGFSLKGLFDYELFPQVWFRGTSGVEGFSVSGSNICGPGNVQACNADLYYLSFDFLGRYLFSMSQYRPWIGGGIGLLFPVSKKASALDSASISTTNVLVAAGGLDWFISPTMYVPISLEYGLLPKSDEVEASWITIRAGLAIPF